MAFAEPIASDEDRGEYHGTRSGKYIGLSFSKKQAGDTPPEEEVTSEGGLNFGITAWHLRWLTNDGFNGGAGYTPNEVAEMTPDQIWFRLCDEKFLRNAPGKGRTRSVSVEEVAVLSKDGKLKGRAADGKLLTLPISIDGKSVVQRLREKQQAETKHQGRKRRR